MITPLFISNIDKEYKEFNSLQFMLDDIYLVDFVENEHDL